MNKSIKGQIDDFRHELEEIKLAGEVSYEARISREKEVRARLFDIAMRYPEFADYAAMASHEWHLWLLDAAPWWRTVSRP